MTESWIKVRGIWHLKKKKGKGHRGHGRRHTYKRRIKCKGGPKGRKKAPA